MYTASPGKLTTVVFTGIPSGVPVGVQVLNAASGLVALARTELGTQERPLGTGTYAATFTAPVEGDLYIVIADWNGGVLQPDMSKTEELRVSTVTPVEDTGLGKIADYAKMHLGGQTWKMLNESGDFGPSFIAQSIDVIKRRAMLNPPEVADEAALPAQVLDYLGILAALQLIGPARDLWGSQAISMTRGDDASETITYANRVSMMNELRTDLMAALPAAQAAALPLLEDPLYTADCDAGPAIDEDCVARVTADPRDVPTFADFNRVWPWTDDFGYETALPRRSGVRVS